MGSMPIASFFAYYLPLRVFVQATQQGRRPGSVDDGDHSLIGSV
jgi:hypothetical protein